MKGLLCITAILFSLFIIGEVQGHSVLKKPSPWWWAASRERPCGGGVYSPIPSDTWEMGETQSLTWWVIALDGNGNVSARIDTAGGATFDKTSPTVKNLTINQPPGLIKTQGYHYLTLKVPEVNCTGPGNTCTIQFWTNNGGGWYTCMTVNITCKGCRPSAPLPADDVCVQAPALSFCAYKSGTQIKLAKAQNATYIDRLINGTYVLNQPNPNVFENGTSAKCRANFKRLLCEYYMPPCGNTSATFSRQTCNDVLWNECGMTEAHKYLYDCTLFRNITEISQPFVPYVPSSQSVNSSQSDPYVPPDYYVASRDYETYVPPNVYVPSDAYVPSDTYVPSDPFVPSNPYVPPSTPSPYYPPSFPSSSKSSTTKSSTASSTTKSSTSSTTKASTSSTTKASTSSTTKSSTSSIPSSTTKTSTASTTKVSSTASTTKTSTTKVSSTASTTKSSTSFSTTTKTSTTTK